MEKVLVMGIGYSNEFVRTPAGWKISSMRGIDVGREAPHDTTWVFAADPVGSLHALLEGD